MSLRMSWQNGGTVEEDVIMGDAESWTTASTILEAGRQVTEWLFDKQSILSQTASAFASWPTGHIIRTADTLTSLPTNIPVSETWSLSQTAHRKNSWALSSLPIELLVQIFSHYVHDPVQFSSKRKISGITAHRDTNTTPLLLGHVCRHWRSITLSVPMLWSSICLMHPQLRHIPLFTLWLERSKQQPLDLGIHEPFPSSSDSAVHQVLLIGFLHCSRWRSVTLELRICPDMINQCLEAAVANNVEAFDLDLRDWDDKSKTGIYRILYSSPSLRRATWRYGMKLSTNPPWKQLSYLAFDRLDSPNDLFAILSRAHSLEHLEIGSMSSDPSKQLSGQIALPQLKTFILHSVGDVIIILDQLVLPSLEDFQLSCGFGFHRESSDGWNSFMKLFSRSQFKLRSFSWLGIRPDEDLLAQTLCSPAMSSLLNLSLRSPMTDRIVIALTRRPGHNPLPHLRHLCMKDCRLGGNTLYHMIISRSLIQGEICRSELRKVTARVRGVVPPKDLVAQILGSDMNIVQI